MQIFLARSTSGNQVPHELLGIFSAAHARDLIDIVDEWFNPDDVEVTLLPPGGIHWRGDTMFKVPHQMSMNDVEEYSGLPNGPVLTEAWDRMFYGINPILRWTPLSMFDDPSLSESNADVTFVAPVAVETPPYERVGP